MKIGESIIEELIKDKEVISATVVGSYTEKRSINNIGDLDIVVICRKLKKNIFERLIRKIKKKKFKKKIIINPTFGPVKINSEQLLPIHLMIYDVNSHKDHVIKSPFTCYDWERSNIFRGRRLKNIFSVKNLKLNDFFNARRNSWEYLNDLKKNQISTRQYYFEKGKVLVKKKLVKIDQRNRGEFVYHVINFLIINLYKFLKNKNIKVSGKSFDNFFLKITKNDKNLLNKFKSIKVDKIKKKLYYDKNIIKIAFKFVKKYNNFIEKIKKQYVRLNFIRHAKTSMNKKDIFLGIKTNPKIISLNRKKIDNTKYDYIITSDLKRTQQTSRLFNYKKIMSNSLVNEINYGDADGMSIKLFKKKYPHIVKGWKKKIDVKFPNGENVNDVKKRVISFLQYLIRFKKNTNLLIISHSFFLRVLISLILKLDMKKAHQIKIEHLKIFQFLIKKNLIISNIDRIEEDKILNN